MKRRGKWGMATFLGGGFGLVLFLAVLIVSLSLYKSTRATIRASYVAQYEQVFGQLNEQLIAAVRRVAQMTAALNNNSELIGACSLARTGKTAAIRSENERVVKTILKTAVGYQPYIDNVGLYFEGARFLMYDTGATEYLSGIPNEPWLQEVLNGERDEVLLPDYQLKKSQYVSNGRTYYKPYFLYARSFNNTLVSRSPGVLLVSLEQAYLSDLFSGMDDERGTIIALLDARDDLIFSRGAQSAQEIQTAMQGCDIFSIRQENERFGWSLLALIPEDVMYHDISLLQSRVATAALIALCLGLGLALFVGRLVARPFRALAQSMERAGEGDLRISAVNSPIREIDRLAGQHDAMLERIGALIERVKTAEREKRVSELSALRAQINPHFTYNTLDSIRWMALMQNAPRVAEKISSLVKLLKLTTGQRGEFVAVAREFEQVALYVDIVRFRYNCRVDVKFDVGPDVSHCRTLGMILQPIVENSFLHGFDNFERPGTICLSAYAQDGALVFRVEDDGRGADLPEGTLPEALPRTGSSLHGGIGVSNVNARLKAWFGEEYGVRFRSAPEQGTIVLLIQPLVPLIEEEETP